MRTGMPCRFFHHSRVLDSFHLSQPGYCQGKLSAKHARLIAFVGLFLITGLLYGTIPPMMDVVSLPLSTSSGTSSPLKVVMGMYTWPSLERLEVVDASGKSAPERTIALEILPSNAP